MSAEERTARQLQKDDTRARLFAAAAEMLLERGYHATTVEKIAARAGVAKGTFFVHFAGKHAVVLELVKIQCGAAKKARARALEKGATPLEALRASAMELGSRAGASRNISRAVLAATLEDPSVGDAVSALFDEVYAEMVVDARAAQKDGLLEKGTDPEQLAGQLMVSYLGSALYFASNPHPKPLIEVLGPLIENSLAAVRRAKSHGGKDAGAEDGHAPRKDPGAHAGSGRARSGRRRV